MDVEDAFRGALLDAAQKNEPCPGQGRLRPEEAPEGHEVEVGLEEVMTFHGAAPKGPFRIRLPELWRLLAWPSMKKSGRIRPSASSSGCIAGQCSLRLIEPIQAIRPMVCWAGMTGQAMVFSLMDGGFTMAMTMRAQCLALSPLRGLWVRINGIDKLFAAFWQISAQPVLMDFALIVLTLLHLRKRDGDRIS